MLHPGPFLASALGATRLILAAGAAGDRAELLPGLADGSRLAALALHEPGQRFAWDRPRTTARREGTGWRLSGGKAPALDAGAADLLLVTARADDGLGVFAVECAGVGVRVAPRSTVDGTRKQAAVELRDAPARRLAGADAREALAATADAMAVGLAVDGVGAAARALELAIAYAKQREQFGQPVGAFQAVQHLLVDMLRGPRAGTRGGLLRALGRRCRRRARATPAASMAKAFASDAFPAIGADAIQVFAGVGFTWEYDIHLYYKRLLTLRHVWGDAGFHLDALARIAVDGDSDRSVRNIPRERSEPRSRS